MSIPREIWTLTHAHLCPTFVMHRVGLTITILYDFRLEMLQYAAIFCSENLVLVKFPQILSHTKMKLRLVV